MKIDKLLIILNKMCFMYDQIWQDVLKSIIVVVYKMRQIKYDLKKKWPKSDEVMMSPLPLGENNPG